MRTLVQPRNVACAAVLAAGVAGLGTALALLHQARAEGGPMVEVPMFEVDPLWPKPIPNEWILGWSIGVAVDDQDNVWMVHRRQTLQNNEKGAEASPPAADCCKAAPPVLAFNPAGDLVRSWGGPGEGYEWPESMHGISIDYKGYVWLGGNGAKDAQVLKFTKDGKFVMQSGHQGKNTGSNDPDNFGRAAQIYVDPKSNKAFVADGYRNKRLVVMDPDTGKIERWWGAYGNKPDDSVTGKYNPAAPVSQQFSNPVHCVALANDGLLYVCDREDDRVQVFHTDGTFVSEHLFAKNTLLAGSTWEIAFSKDPQQHFIYLTDGENERVRILERSTMKELTSFGRGGRQPGEFYGVHSIAVDSKGNIYTTETFEGRRLQKFIYKGMGMVPLGSEQGPVWPKRASL